MNTRNRIAPVLALLACLPLAACDKGDKGDDKDLQGATTNDSESGDSESEGGAESSSEGGAEEGAESSSEGGDSDSGSTSTTGGEELPCDAEHLEASRPCDTGTQFCAYDGVANTFAWGVCVAHPVCTPGVEVPCEECVLTEQGVPEVFDSCGSGESSTPLVLSFDGAPVEYGNADRHFDLGTCAATDWPTARTPWLALDRDRSGHIDGGHELFGSATRLRTGALADQGFTALAELDADHDGKITAADPAFTDLVLWSDADADRRSSGLELQPLAAQGLVAIELTYASDRRCDARANCEIERASFTWRDALGRERTGEVVDVHLACQ